MGAAPTGSRILVYDLESTSLNADDGDLLVFAYKWLDEKKAHVPSVLDTCLPCDGCKRIHIDDRALVRQAHAIMSQADVMLTFNGKNFDIKYMQSKFMRYGLPALPEISHVDLYQTARTKMRLTRKSLANISHYLQLTNEKTKLDWDIWRRAAKGYTKEIRYIRDHGAADIYVTQELYEKHMRQYVRQHPRVSGYGPCRRCGADTLERRGVAVTILKGQQHRYQCRTCAGWEQRAA